jgi:hypothetical protein
LLIGAIALIALFLVTMPFPRLRHQQLARRRERIDAAKFERLMTSASVSATTTRFLWRELAPHYHHPLRPMPGDRLESQIFVDRPEIEGLIMHFWRSMRGSDPFPAFSPLAPDPTVAELGRHLDLMAGWTIRSAA